MIETQNNPQQELEKPIDHSSLIKEILDEQERLTAKLKDAPQKVTESLFNEYISGEQPREPYALSPKFVYNLEFSEAVPKHIGDVLLAALRHKPDSAISLQPLPPSTLRSKLDELETNTRAQFKAAQTESEKVDLLIGQIDRKKELHQESIAEEQKFICEQVINLLLSFGLSTELSDDAILEIYQKIIESNALTLELVHFKSMLREAKTALSTLAPNLAPIFDHIESKIVLTRKVPFFTVRSYAKTIADQKTPNQKKQHLVSSNTDIENADKDEYEQFWKNNLNWSEITLSEGSFIEVDNSTFDVRDSNQRHAEQIVILAHELVHSTVTYLLDESLELISSDQYTNRIHASSLWHTIQEGIAIAFEMELAESLLHDPNLSDQDKERISQYKKYRLEALQRATSHWKMSVRAIFMGPDKIVPRPSEFGELSYSEGSKLALVLKKNGWQLSDLSFFIRQIKQVIYEELKTGFTKGSLTVPVSKEKELNWLFREKTSRYLTVRKKIRSLKPDFTAA